MDEPGTPRDVIQLSVFEGLACAAGATFAAGPIFIAMIDQGFPGRVIPGAGRLVLSLAALFTVALVALRLRTDVPVAEWRLGRSAMLVTVAMAVGACVSCGVARWDLFWVVPSGPPLLLMAVISIAISPGKRLRRAAVAGACVVALALLPFTCWPLRLTVWLWRGSLEEVAARVESGGASSTPEWVGPFWFVKSSNGYDDAFLVTRIEWAGDFGLARHGAVNDFYRVDVGSGWDLVYED